MSEPIVIAQGLKEVLDSRRSYRALEKTEVSADALRELAMAASLAPSCYNNQPWRFVFAKSPEVLAQLGQALSKGNEWARNASVIAAVFSRSDLDCQIKGKEYYPFDTGIAAGFLMLRAWDMGLVAHPIAGYDEAKVKEILAIPADMNVLALLIIGRHSGKPTAEMNAQQIEGEKKRPPRIPFEDFAWLDKYTHEQ